MDPVKLMIGEEEIEFSREDLVKGIGEQQGLKDKVSQMEESFNGVTLAANQYGTDTKTYLESAESAFGVLNSLVESGIIDESGAILGKEAKSGEGNPPTPKSSGGETPKPGSKMEVNEDILATAIEKVLAAKLGNLPDKLKQIESSQSTLFKAGLSSRIKAKHPGFTDADVEVTLNNAFEDRTKDLWAHAEIVKESNKTLLGEQEKVFAKKYGVDLETVQKTRELKEQRATGGIASLFKGKKFSFRKKARNDEGFIRPSDAVRTAMGSQ